jgi:hypothetical protein
VAPAVSRQENDLAAGESAREQGIRWRAEWGIDLPPFLLGETFEVVKSGAANDADFGIRHAKMMAFGHGRPPVFFSAGVKQIS